MKRILLLSLVVTLVASIGFSQTTMNTFRAYPLVPLATKTTSDYATAVKIPFDVGKLIAYVRVDSISTGDSLKVVFQGSSDNSAWFSVDSTSWFTAVGSERKVISSPDLYMRTINYVTGTSIRNRFKVDLVGRP
jgi:hypothetical protein